MRGNAGALLSQRLLSDLDNDLLTFPEEFTDAGGDGAVGAIAPVRALRAFRAFGAFSSFGARWAFGPVGAFPFWSF